MADGSMHRDRMVLNANIGKTNVMEFDEFQKIAVKTLDDLTELILPLCGPQALNDLVVYEHVVTDMMSNVFSNDGIHILKSIEYMSPIQEFLTNYVKYIAQRVEQAAGDGTSTAIYLTTRLLSRVLTLAAEIREHSVGITDGTVSIISHRQVMFEINRLAAHVTQELQYYRDQLEHLKIDLKDLDRETRQDLIYRLAYTTSKGNEQLSKFAVELFVDLPELLYEQTQSRRSQVETEQPLEIEYPEHDAQLAVKASGTTIYNTDMNTVWSYDDADLLPVAMSINNNNVGPLLEFIDKRQEATDRQLLILVNGIDESCQSKLEKAIDPTKVTLARSVHYHPSFVSNPTELKAILAMAGGPTHPPSMLDDYHEVVIEGVKLVLDYKELRIFNLIHEGEGALHPYYQDPDLHQPYTDLRLELEEHIEALKTSHQKKSYLTEINEFTRIYRMMICSKLPMLMIGGSTVEHLALVNVVEDVLGVVSVAMKHGVIVDLIPKLHRLIAKIKYLPNDLRWREIFKDYWRLTYQTDEPLDKSLNAAIECLYPAEDLLRLMTLTNGTKWVPLTQGKPTVVQSFKAIDETFVRLKETLPKLISTDRIIVPNSVVNKEKENE